MGFIVKGGGGSGEGGTTDHNALINKNLPNQHTIAAITGLLDELGKRPQTTDVNAMINSIIDGAPEAYNTLKEIADYIAQDQSAVASILSALGNKVDKEAGKGLSSNDYTNSDKGKVDNLNITQVVDLDEVKNASHAHANTIVLNKIGEDENGNIIYNNNHVNDKLANARTIAISGKVTGTATSFDGSSNIAIPVTSVIADSCTGNAGTANKLGTARTIAISGKVTGTATSFDGSSNISIPITAVTADSCTGNSATATNATNHINETSNAHSATSISNTPSGNILATTVQGAINELDAEKAPAGYGLGGDATGLPSIDLNTLTKCGFYNYYGSTLNKPTGSSGFVIVSYKSGYATQIATDLTAITYTRVMQGTTWSAWKRLATTNDITASDANFSFSTDNTYSFGTSGKRATQVYAATATINTSDRNAKTDITETQLGLDFINKLKPVEYKYKVRQNVVEQIQDGTQTIEIAPAEINEKGEVIKKAEVQEIPVYKEVVTSLPGVRTHLGLIAQDVEECLGGRDIAIVTKDENGYGLRYEELIAPLIKAVQELSAEVAELRNNKKK